MTQRYAPLVSAKHPVATDLRILVDVDFVRVEHRLVGSRARFEIAKLLQNKLSALAWPRTALVGRRGHSGGEIVLE